MVLFCFSFCFLLNDLISVLPEECQRWDVSIIAYSEELLKGTVRDCKIHVNL